jgi:hypothetical protein
MIFDVGCMAYEYHAWEWTNMVEPSFTYIHIWNKYAYKTAFACTRFFEALRKKPCNWKYVLHKGIIYYPLAMFYWSNTKGILLLECIDVEVIHLEACESGSIFEGLSLKDMNIYVNIAPNIEKNSWATYCGNMVPPSPFEYDNCLSDLYSATWMENAHNQYFH